jgi:hypothetical protein
MSGARGTSGASGTARWRIELGSRSHPLLVEGRDRPRLAQAARACGAGAPRRVPAGGRAVLRCPDSTHGPGELLAQFEESLDEHAVQTAGDRLLMHASAVTDARGGACLFTGPSGAGKSTLAAALARRGRRWVGDECLPLGLDPPSVEVVRRPIALRRDVLAWFDAAPGDGRVVDGGSKCYWIGRDLARSAARRPLRLSRLVILGTVAEPGPLDAGAAFAALLASCHGFQARGAPAFRALAEVARSVPALAFSAVGGADAVDALEQLLDGRDA